MAHATLPITSRGSSDANNFSDVFGNDAALRDQLNGNIDNSNIAATAGINFSKLASTTAGYVLLGNASGVVTATAVTGDVTISSSGVTAIASGAIVNADVNGSAAIAYSKLNLATSIVQGDLSSALAGTLGIGSSARDYAEVLTEESLGAELNFVDLATVGPSVTVTVPTSGLVAVMIEAELRETVGAGGAFVGLHETTDLASPVTLIGTASTSYVKKWSQQIAGSLAETSRGTTNRIHAGLIVFPATPGTRTYKMQYKSVAGAADADFKNRKLWVATLGGF